VSHKVHYPWFKKEDVDGFFALFQNNLANFALLAVVMLGMNFPAAIVFGQMIPGAAVSVAAGNFYYAHMARRLAEKEGRTDVTALSYGISTPVQFIYMYGIIGATLTASGDHVIAWKLALAAVLVGGVIEALGGFVGRQVRNLLPRAAMLGALAGVAFSFIAGEMFFKTYSEPVVGIIALTLIIFGLVGKALMPGRVPAALFAVLVGTVAAYVFGVAEISNLATGMSNIGFYFPLPGIAVFEGLKLLFTEYSHLLAIIIPISVYNFIETMNNVEAVASLGDNYDVKEAQIADGIGTMLGALFGGVVPTTVYIASVGAKDMNAGRGYSTLNGVVFLIAAAFGLVGAISQIIPLAVIAPILVYVGISMVSNAFTHSPQRHAPAVALAMIPYLANYIMSRFNRGDVELLNSGANLVRSISPNLVPLGQGAMFTALVWGAVAVFIIDREYIKAAIGGLTLAGLAAVGLIHAPKLQILASPVQTQFALGYVILAVFCFIYPYIGGKATEEKKTIGLE
jgi:AGZA family xanthine/uracil permease-like MFS transporter